MAALPDPSIRSVPPSPSSLSASTDSHETSSLSSAKPSYLPPLPAELDLPPLNRELIISNLRMLVDNLRTLQNDLSVRTEHNERLKASLSEALSDNSALRRENEQLRADLRRATKEARMHDLSLAAGGPRTPIAPEVTEVLSILKSTRDRMNFAYAPDEPPEMDRLAGLRRSMSPSPTKSLTVEGLAKGEGFDAFDASEEDLEELSSPKRDALADRLVAEVDESVLGDVMLDDVLKEETLAISVIKSCEKRVGELHTNRVVQDLFGKPASPPQTLVPSPNGNPFEDLDVVVSGKGGEDDFNCDLDASFLALRPD